MASIRIIKDGNIKERFDAESTTMQSAIIATDESGIKWYIKTGPSKQSFLYGFAISETMSSKDPFKANKDSTYKSLLHYGRFLHLR